MYGFIWKYSCEPLKNFELRNDVGQSFTVERKVKRYKMRGKEAS